MTYAAEFMEHCIQTLESNFGNLTAGIIKRAKSQKILNDNSSLNDFKEFVHLIELNIGLLSGKTKAAEICDDLMKKATEGLENQEDSDISLSDDIEKDVHTFLAQNILPNEDDINDYAKYLAMKYGDDARNVKKDIIAKVKTKIKDSITIIKISSEIDNFLARYPQPVQTDIDDFVNYLRLSNMCPDEKQLRDQIEKERLFRKFHGPGDVVETTEIDQFLDTIRTLNNKDEINSAIKEQKLSYLITDDSKVSDPMLSEFIELTAPEDEDIKNTLEGLGLKHMIKE